MISVKSCGFKHTTQGLVTERSDGEWSSPAYLHVASRVPAPAVSTPFFNTRISCFPLKVFHKLLPTRHPQPRKKYVFTRLTLIKFHIMRLCEIPFLSL